MRTLYVRGEPQHQGLGWIYQKIHTQLGSVDFWISGGILNCNSKFMLKLQVRWEC